MPSELSIKASCMSLKLGAMPILRGLGVPLLVHAELEAELRNRIQGTVATTYNEIEQRIDIAVRLPLDLRYDLPTVLASPVAVGEGKTVPLGSFVVQATGTPVRVAIKAEPGRAGRSTVAHAPASGKMPSTPR